MVSGVDTDPQETSGETQPDRRGRRKRRRIRLAVVLLVLLAGAAVAFQRPLFSGNVGVVDPGKVIRSAQPTANLPELIDEYQPKSILNLRGGSYRNSWYDAEVSATEQHGIDFYDFPMEATERPTKAQLLTLVDLLDHCQYPLLIHCKRGADRTGLVSGLYRLSVLGQTPDEALDSFSIWHLHFPVNGTQRLHEPFVEYRDWLAAEGKTHAPGLFREWVEEHYEDHDSPSPSTLGGPLKPGPRMGTKAEWQARNGLKD